MTNVTPIDEAKKFVRESYLATLGAGQLVLDKAKDLSSSATRYARGGRSSVDSTVGDSEITVAGRSNRASASRNGSARSVPSP